MADVIFDPGADCDLCPRLQAFRNENRTLNPDWHNAPVDTWVTEDGDEAVKLLIIGLAPGLRGANRTARPFTGDWAGDLLYATLLKFGFASGHYGGEANDDLVLRQSAITNAVRCVPPQNKPVAFEINQCRPFLQSTMTRFPNLQALVTLGKISHDSTLRALGIKLSAGPFGHGHEHKTDNLTIFSSYHCSRYNTNTGRLTEAMFEDVFRSVRSSLS